MQEIGVYIRNGRSALICVCPLMGKKVVKRASTAVKQVCLLSVNPLSDNCSQMLL